MTLPGVSSYGEIPVLVLLGTMELEEFFSGGITWDLGAGMELIQDRGSSVPVDGFDVGNGGDLRSSSDRNMCVMDGCANEL